MKQLIILFTLFYLGASHSWLHCVDYDKRAPLNVSSIDNSRCSAFPRDLSAASVFGIDRGYDYQPSDSKPCRSSSSKENLGLVNYIKGETYRLLWPAKNHQADVCTNPDIPDNQLKVFFYPSEEVDPTLTEWTQEKYLVQDFKKNGRGFQNCPDFCSGPDKAPCFGDLKIPDSLDGRYGVLWFWEFNKKQFYTHCYDVEVSTLPKPNSSTSPQQVNCSKMYGQCGGRTWRGATCGAEGNCTISNVEYSQCLPSKAPGSTTQAPGSTTQAPGASPTPEVWKLCRCKC